MKAIIITFDKYPNQDAGAVRLHMFAHILKDTGYSVKIISMGQSTDFVWKEKDDIEYVSFRSRREGKCFRILDYILFPIHLAKELSKETYKVILHTQIDKISLDVIKSYSKRKKCNLLYDAVEWFSPEQFMRGEKSRGYKQNDAYNTKWIGPEHQVIAISHYLTEHFVKREIDTINVPVILDVQEISFKKNLSEDKVKIVYAGSPGKKDYLGNVVRAIGLLKAEERKKIEFIIIGVTEKQLVDMFGVSRGSLEQIKSTVKIRGKVSRDEVLKELQSADFTILIRNEKQRYAKAGFPTKYVESLATGTPVICNLTSDISEYTEDMVNGVVVNDAKEESICVALEKVLALTGEQRKAMCLNARKVAENRFDYRLFTPKIKHFIDKND
ncbi:MULTISPECIES: glycosyltransferase [Eubacteriales]|uniref:glycosyltransferase n=1 Tax=Eubacteriales TaxID=186802 RepID=UPI0011071187|nr:MULTISPECIES: glycosyltransferase [Eubacteriales]